MKEHDFFAYCVGDRVRIVDEWPEACLEVINDEGKMDHWRGKVMTIRAILVPGCYLMEEDQNEGPFTFGDRGGWTWLSELIAGFAEEKE